MPIEKNQNLTNQPIPRWKLKLSYFYVSNKIIIKKFLLFLLFFSDLLIIFLFGKIWINYQTTILKNQNYLRQLSINLIDHKNLNIKFKAQKLKIISTTAILTSQNKYDFLAVVENNNKNWLIKELNYTFNVNGQNLDTKTTFVLPSSKKFLMYFNADNATNLKLKILNIKWQRVQDYSLISYKDEIKINKAIFIPPFSSKSNGQMKIEIFNNTPYNFWEIGLPIILYNKNSEVIGINYIISQKLEFQKTKEIEIGWPNKILTGIAKIEIYPEVNLTNTDCIMRIKAPAGSPPGQEY